jgi:hypothetical protein
VTDDTFRHDPAALVGPVVHRGSRSTGVPFDIEDCCSLEESHRRMKWARIERERMMRPLAERGNWRRSFFFPDDDDADRDWSYVGFAPRKTRSLTATYARMGEADWFRTAYDGQRILDEGES